MKPEEADVKWRRIEKKEEEKKEPINCLPRPADVWHFTLHQVILLKHGRFNDMYTLSYLVVSVHCDSSSTAVDKLNLYQTDRCLPSKVNSGDSQAREGNETCLRHEIR